MEGYWIYRGPKARFKLPSAPRKTLAQDGPAVELDRREASIIQQYAARGHRFEYAGRSAPAAPEEG